MKRALFLSAAFVMASATGCGAADPPPKVAPWPAPVAEPPPRTRSTEGPPSVPPARREPPGSSLSPEAEVREILEQLVAVDTSHGNETAALTPIRARLEQAGISSQILESAPGRGNLIARIKGNGTKKPLLLLAHIDVVPVEGQPWTVAPFKPIEKEGFLYGRGINDDKSMAAAIVMVALEIARAKTVLSRDVIVALTAGEETGGFAGVQWLVKNHRELLDAEIALNEGAGIELSANLAKVQSVGLGTAEKTYQSYHLTAKGKGGHSSVPLPGADPVLSLARALVKVGELTFPAHIVPEEKANLAERAASATPPMSEALRRAVASAPRVLPADDKVISADRIYNAHIRTTCVATMLEGSTQDNVLPTSAKATVNCRILPGETREATQATIVKAIGDATIEVAPVADFGFGPPSPLEGAVPVAVRHVASAMWPGVPVVPSMSTGATDSRHLRAVGILAYGVGTAPSSLDEARAGHSAHGPDERRPVAWIGDGLRFLREVTLTLAK